eukprot:4685849-Alexandrium_andersonii.AAC.1
MAAPGLEPPARKGGVSDSPGSHPRSRHRERETLYELAVQVFCVCLCHRHGAVESLRSWHSDAGANYPKEPSKSSPPSFPCAPLSPLAVPECGDRHTC